MSDAEEVTQLREQLEQYRLRELADLRQQLAEAKTAAEHYRSEAQRNADLGRKIAAEYEVKLSELRTKLEILQESQRNVTGLGAPGR